MLATSKGQGPIVLVIAAVLLVSAGCNSHSTADKSAEKATDQPARADSGDESVTPARDADMDQVQLIEPPTKEGLRLQYRSDISAFNFAGDAALTPVTPKQVWEYRIGKSLRAIAVLDELTGDAIVIVSDCSGQEEGTFSLNGQDGKAKGWLLRGQSPEPVKQEDIRRLLAKPEESSRAFELKGQVAIDLKNGYVQSMSLVDVATRANVPADDRRLRSKIEFWQHQLDQLTRQAQANPSDELLAWGVQQAEDNLSRFHRLVETQARSPAQLTNGRIAAEWVRRKPLLEIELP